MRSLEWAKAVRIGMGVARHASRWPVSGPGKASEMPETCWQVPSSLQRAQTVNFKAAGSCRASLGMGRQKCGSPHPDLRTRSERHRSGDDFHSLRHLVKATCGQVSAMALLREAPLPRRCWPPRLFSIFRPELPGAAVQAGDGAAGGTLDDGGTDR